MRLFVKAPSGAAADRQRNFPGGIRLVSEERDLDVHILHFLPATFAETDFGGHARQFREKVVNGASNLVFMIVWTRKCHCRNPKVGLGENTYLLTLARIPEHACANICQGWNCISNINGRRSIR